MNKKLKLETIVPKNLYIERNADKQLTQIINDMSRPASILVARQMGKTNLLLNTKRELENKETIFIYIDLSKIDNNMRDCFRYIVDTAIDTNLDIFEDIENNILKIREKDRLPYREHEQELLVLLRKFNGKIIIILDEIDSMKKFDFSDQFFSQIRSVYFSSRVNFSEFNNLTYILSGVLEPSEIIHDKTKSPFNISEKVYLNDFTKIEFLEFIEKIDFDFFTENIIDKIFDWTNGHPRMIWNICSKLEEKYLENNTLSIDNVDEIIEKLYFIHSDIPPIDHIKNLLNENHDIVQTILELKQGITLNITDQIKNKLYLYGIVDIVSTDKIEIKNKIIDTILSEEYLKNILYASKTSYELALDLYKKNEFKLALTEFSKNLENENIIISEKNYSHYYMGLCLFKINEYDLALSSFEQAKFDNIGEANMFWQTEFDKAICSFWLNNYNESLKKYDEIIKNKNTPIILKINANSNKGAVYIKTGESSVLINKSLNKAIELLEKNKEDLEPNYYTDTLARIYFNKAQHYQDIKENNQSIKEYKKILQLDNIEKFKPNVILELIKLEPKKATEYLSDIFKIIKTNSLKIEHNEEINFSINSLCRYVYDLIHLKNEKLLNEVLNYCQNTYDVFKSKCSVLTTCSDYYFDDKNKTEEIYLNCLQYEESEISSKECYRNVYVNLVYIYYQNNDYNKLKTYSQYTISSIIETQDKYELNFNHYNIINIILETMIENNDFDSAKKAYEQIEDNIITKISEEYIIFKAILLDKKHDLSIDLKDKKVISQKCVKIISENKKSLNNLHKYTISYANYIRKKHGNFLYDNTERKPTINTSKIKRNDPCPCGSGNKYKKCCGR